MVRCIVQKSRPSSNVKVKGQSSRSPGTKDAHSAADTPRVHTNDMRWLKTACSSSSISGRAHFVAVGGVVQLCYPPVLRRWESQRMLSSCLGGSKQSSCFSRKDSNMKPQQSVEGQQPTTSERSHRTCKNLTDYSGGPGDSSLL